MMELLTKLRARLGQTEASAIPMVATAAAEFEPQLARVKNMALAVSLRKLFEESHFNICRLQQILDVARVIPDGEVYRMLRLLHCVDWMDMPKELRLEVQRLIIDMLGEGRPS